jgi:tousled-like kinase
MNVLVDKNKLALLQGRLGVSPSNDSNHVTQSNNVKQTPPLEVQTDLKHEIIDICDISSPGSHSKDRSNDKSNDKTVVDWPKSLLRYEEHSNSSNSKHIRDATDLDGKKENTPKRQKQDGVDPSPDGNNSRGAVTGMRKLETYFQSNGPSSFAATNKSLLSSSIKAPPSSNSSSAAGPEDSSQSLPHSAPAPSSAQASVTAATTYSTITTTSAHTASASATAQQNEKAATAKINVITADFRKQNEQLRLAKDQYEQKAQRLDAEMRSAIERMRQTDDRNNKLSSSLEDVHRRMAIQEARRKRDRLAQDNVRLGKIQTVRVSATSVGDVWEEGYALKELDVRTAEVSERREELEKRRNRLKAVKRKYMAKQSAGNDVHNNHMENNVYYDATTVSDIPADSITDLEIIGEESALRTHMDQLKKDENALLEARHLLEAEKTAHQKELKRCKSEDRSRFFANLPSLNGRYLLLSLLGRGGFSEVWKALDLVELREVAVKIHQLNPTWSDARKQSYVKHVTREYTIHRDLNHPRVVLLFDVFEIDVNSFATVLELCHGTDLDEKLKTQKTIPEKDAKTILMQIIFGLRYLNAGSMQAVPTMSNSEDRESGGAGERVGSPGAMPPPAVIPRRRSIIHFDLKPANILFDSMGDVKITDFGLSKILDEADEGMTSVELTSQGAGTYWYLPPECFDRGDAPPRISSKVDVWSLGVILYQMLFGKRPFGEGKSQERVLSEGIMLNATRVEFPQEGLKTHSNGAGSVSTVVPKVSDEGKDFIKACLTWDQKHRPDVFQLCQHPYLRPPAKKS